MGADGKSRQTYKVIGYYESREAAMEALAEYHKYPLIEDNYMTFSDVYKRWSEEHFQHLTESGKMNYTVPYKSCEPLYNMFFKDIRLHHLQEIVDHCDKSYSSVSKIRTLFSMMYKYAIQHDICNKDYSDGVFIRKSNDDETEEKHKIFTTNEIRTLWQNAPRSQSVRIILMLICSGLRIGELLDLLKENVNLAERYIKVKKSKTSSGIRIVPIPECVVPYWQEMMNHDSIYVIRNKRDPHRRMSYQAYQRYHFTPTLEQIGFEEHFPHDTRYTFVSVMTSANVRPIFIKRIVGHKSKDITERVYTKFEIQQLVEAVNTPNWKNPYDGIVTVV